jgi:hypothetical protein
MDKHPLVLMQDKTAPTKTGMVVVVVVAVVATVVATAVKHPGVTQEVKLDHLD